jgi:hypothetical protein
MIVTSRATTTSWPKRAAIKSEGVVACVSRKVWDKRRKKPGASASKPIGAR